VRKSKKRPEFKYGDLLSLRSCVPESLRTQIESHENNMASMWVDNGSLALFIAKQDSRVTIMCNGYIGWVWYDECRELQK